MPPRRDGVAVPPYRLASSSANTGPLDQRGEAYGGLGVQLDGLRLQALPVSLTLAPKMYVFEISGGAAGVSLLPPQEASSNANAVAAISRVALRSE